MVQFSVDDLQPIINLLEQTAAGLIMASEAMLINGFATIELDHKTVDSLKLNACDITSQTQQKMREMLSEHYQTVFPESLPVNKDAT